MTSNPMAALEELRSEFHALCHKIGALLVYLFGSQARGQAFPFSDVDFAVAFAPEVPAAEQSQRQVEMITELMSLLKRNDVDVMVLERATPLLRHRAATEGIVVYQASPYAHADFLVQALGAYDDRMREAEASALRARYGRRQIVASRLRALKEYTNALREFAAVTRDDLECDLKTRWTVLQGSQDSRDAGLPLASSCTST